MFVTVLHGDNEEALFNIHCRVQLLLEGIKRTCHCEPEVEIELADENGQIKNLLENRHCYASEILSERETCILLAVSRPAGTTEAVFTPLLNDEDIINSKFLAKLGNWGESKSSSSRTKSKRHSRKSVVIQSMSLLDGKPSPPQPGKSKSTASTTKKRAGKS
ncbi:uncharacterized protein CXorf65 homolog isoform X1 [Pleurodeles waltl]|uniref:uncharacterized protein CXorf65 homolog isoform X1 n=1 Tax=Pleurodeles waltl TaxID=8319 RepID=UPI0037095CDA